MRVLMVTRDEIKIHIYIYTRAQYVRFFYAPGKRSHLRNFSNLFLNVCKMTITYTDQVATCRGLGCFWKLLFR